MAIKLHHAGQWHRSVARITFKVIEALPTLNDAEQAQAVLAEKAVGIMARPSATMGGFSWLI